MPLVIDASAILPLTLPDEDATISNGVLVRIAMDRMARVPPVFWDELLNVLVRAEREGRIDRKRAEAFFLKVRYELPLITTPPVSQLEVFHIAHDYGLTAYDASYLTLAIQTESELATHDKELISAAKRGNVPLYHLIADAA